MKRYKVTLDADERQHLHDLIASGKAAARKLTNGLRQINAAGEKRPAVKQNIFGGSLGGPVVNEKFGFFFVNYQGTRQRSALSPGTQINNPAFPILPADRSAANLASIFSPPASGSCPLSR